jgi:hypothetical protein
MTTGNANVFYELGLAHAIGVPTVLIAEQAAAEEIPFDLRQYRTEFYETHFQRADGIKRALSKLASTHASGEAAFGSPISDFLPGAARPAIRARRSGGGKPTSQEAPPADNSHSEEPRGTTDKPEPLGILDFVDGLGDAAQGFGRILEEVNAATERIGTDLSGLTAEINGLDPASPTAQAQGKKLLLKTANLLDGYADNLSKHEAVYDQQVDGITANGLGYLTLLAEKPKQFREEIESARTTSLELRTSVEDASRGMLELRDAIADLPPMIKQIVRARDRGVHALDVLIAQQERVRSYAEQAIMMTDAALRQVGAGAVVGAQVES